MAAATRIRVLVQVSTRRALTTSASPITRRAARGAISIASRSGSFPLATSAFPLGVQKGQDRRDVALTGYNLGAGKVRREGRALA